MKRRTGYFSISAVSEMLGVHQQTIRMYERQGLISPRRSGGNTRLFSEEDIDRLEEIIYYTNKVGVNLAGIEVIFKMQKHIEDLQNELQNKMSDAFKKSHEELEKQRTIHLNAAQTSAQHLESIKNESKKKIQKSKKETVAKRREDDGE